MHFEMKQDIFGQNHFKEHRYVNGDGRSFLLEYSRGRAGHIRWILGSVSDD